MPLYKINDQIMELTSNAAKCRRRKGQIVELVPRAKIQAVDDESSNDSLYESEEDSTDALNIEEDFLDRSANRDYKRYKTLTKKYGDKLVAAAKLLRKHSQYKNLVTSYNIAAAKLNEIKNCKRCKRCNHHGGQ